MHIPVLHALWNIINMVISYIITWMYRTWASYQIRKIVGCACAGNAGNIFPYHRLQRKPLVSDIGIHHGTCVTHVTWCMSGSLTRGGRENVPGIPGIPGASATRNFTYLVRGPYARPFRTSLPYAAYNSVALAKLFLVKFISGFLLFVMFWEKSVHFKLPQLLNEIHRVKLRKLLYHQSY